jgi:hypothetical protein
VRSRQRPLALSVAGREIVLLANDANLLIAAGERLLASITEQMQRGGAGASGATPEAVAALDAFIGSLAEAAQTIADPPLRIEEAADIVLLRRLLTELKGYQRGEITPGLRELRLALEA